MTMLQLTQLHKEYDKLQKKYGDPTLSSIYGAGCINKPEIMFIFMNPTGKNNASLPSWSGLRAPWIGTKQVWEIFNKLNLLDESIYQSIKRFKPANWDVDFASKVYESIGNHNIFITNLAKCTQIDARPLNNSVFKEYLDLIYKEIDFIKPQRIVTFGNQVSSVFLGKNVSVSNYKNIEKEVFRGYDIYPTYYPVGQGRRNMPLAIDRLLKIF